MIIGFDFDNTLIDYSNSFKKLVLKKKLVPEEIKKDKISIRNYLRKKDLENQWTILQGEVYGKYIMNGQIFNGVQEVFKYLETKKIKVKIISHKTRFPYIGEKVDLRLSALKWIEANIFSQVSNIFFSKKDIFFQNSVEEKIEKIKDLKCDVYVDDLPEILDLLPNKIQKILYLSSNNKPLKTNYKIMHTWLEFRKVIEQK